MIKLSVVMAVYNAEKYLSQSINSLLNQSFQDFEVIIIDDASTDNSTMILKEFVKNRKNVHYLKNKYNEGYGYSRNRGFLKANGEYVAIHDADDMSLPIRFEKQVNLLDNNPEITITGGHAIRINDSGQEIGFMCYPPENTKDAFRVIEKYKLNPIIDPTSLFRKKTILEIGAYRIGEEWKTVHDFDLWCRLLVKGYLLYNFQEPLIKYRINPQGITRTKKQKQVEATDQIWATFKTRTFPKVELNPEFYEQDFILDILNNDKEKKHGESPQEFHNLDP